MLQNIIFIQCYSNITYNKSTNIIKPQIIKYTRTISYPIKPQIIKYTRTISYPIKPQIIKYTRIISYPIKPPYKIKKHNRTTIESKNIFLPYVFVIFGLIGLILLVCVLIYNHSYIRHKKHHKKKNHTKYKPQTISINNQQLKLVCIFFNQLQSLKRQSITLTPTDKTNSLKYQVQYMQQTSLNPQSIQNEVITTSNQDIYYFITNKETTKDTTIIGIPILIKQLKTDMQPIEDTFNIKKKENKYICSLMYKDISVYYEIFLDKESCVTTVDFKITKHQTKDVYNFKYNNNIIHYNTKSQNYNSINNIESYFPKQLSIQSDKIV